MGLWKVLVQHDFDLEIRSMDVGFQDELLALAVHLERFGPQLGRPLVDTLKGSAFGNMKELRFGWQGGVWRVAFAFDPERRAILLVAGNKRGLSQDRFYRRLIRTADTRYAAHLAGTLDDKVT